MLASAKASVLLVLVAFAVAAMFPARASAASASGPHEVVSSQLTTKWTSAPSGFSYAGVYHAAGNSNGNPPYMRRMISYPPPGTHYDTSVPEQCSATDLQLATQGPSACPPDSRLGGGTTASVFLGMFPSTLELDLFNNTGQQIILARSPVVTTVARGEIHRDGSIEFASPTCFPNSSVLTQCPVDDVLQLRSSIVVAPYVRYRNGRLRSYLTTAPYCPRSGRWQTPIKFWWADRTVDAVMTTQSCLTRRSSRTHRDHRRRHHRT